MLNDAMRFGDIAERDRGRVSERIEALSWGFEYGQRFELGKGVRFELGRAGHILGSCFVRFECGREGFSVLFSGDLGNRGTPLLCDPDRAQSADFLVLESTYGDRLHGDRTRRVERLASILDRCLRDGGKVYIPAFALGRTQEMLYELNRIFSEGAFSDRYPSLAEGVRPPVFVDTPLGLEITEIYSSLSEFWDREAGAFLAGGDHPLDFKGLFAVERHFQHEQLMAVEGPAIIIAGSGMCTGGRMVDHLALGIGDARNDVVLVGYMAEGTPGRAIQEEEKSVVLDGVKREVRAGVHVLSGYSAHADRQGLLDWVGAMDGRPGMIRLVHGDDGARRALGTALVGLGYSVG